LVAGIWTRRRPREVWGICAWATHHTLFQPSDVVPPSTHAIAVYCSSNPRDGSTCSTRITVIHANGLWTQRTCCQPIGACLVFAWITLHICIANGVQSVSFSTCLFCCSVSDTHHHTQQGYGGYTCKPCHVFKYPPSDQRSTLSSSYRRTVSSQTRHY